MTQCRSCLCAVFNNLPTTPCLWVLHALSIHTCRQSTHGLLGNFVGLDEAIINSITWHLCYFRLPYFNLHYIVHGIQFLGIYMALKQRLIYLHRLCLFIYTHAWCVHCILVV
jgi:hypothetical protein